MWNVYFVMSLILLMAFSVFLYDWDNLSERLGTILTLFLTMTAYKFAISEHLPQIGYNTQVDIFVIFAFGFLFFTFVSNCALSTVGASGPTAELMLFFGSLLVFLGGYIYCASRAFFAIKHRYDSLESTEFGSIDTGLRQQLEKHGVKLSEHGIVEDRQSLKQAFQRRKSTLAYTPLSAAEGKTVP